MEETKVILNKTMRILDVINRSNSPTKEVDTEYIKNKTGMTKKRIADLIKQLADSGRVKKRLFVEQKYGHPWTLFVKITPKGKRLLDYIYRISEERNNAGGENESD